MNELVIDGVIPNCWDDIQIIAKTTARCVVFKSLTFDKFPQALCDALFFRDNNITEIRIENCDGVYNFIELLRKNDTITHLSIYQGFVRQEDVEKISRFLIHNYTVESLAFCDCEINEDVFTQLLDPLSRNKFITSFTCEWNNINFTTLEPLCKMLTLNHNIEYLDISHNFFQPGAIRPLADLLKSNKLTSLKTLDITYNNLNADDLITLLDALKTNTTLLSIHCGTPFVPKNAVEVQILEMLDANKTLIGFDIGTNKDIVAKIEPFIRRNRLLKNN